MFAENVDFLASPQEGLTFENVAAAVCRRTAKTLLERIRLTCDADICSSETTKFHDELLPVAHAFLDCGMEQEEVTGAFAELARACPARLIGEAAGAESDGE